MKFVKECKYCGTIIKEVDDQTYKKLVSHKFESICDRCDKNLKDLGILNE